MADKNMGSGLERSKRIEIIRMGDKAPAVATTLALQRQQENFLKITPIPDKDEVEKDLSLVRRRLRTKADGLTKRALSGNPWEVARAHSEIEELLEHDPSSTQPEPTPVVPIIKHTTTQFIAPEKPVEKGGRSTLDRAVDKVISQIVGLYRHVASGEIKGLDFGDVDRLMEGLRDPDKRETASHDVGGIVNPIEEKVKT